jgi:formylglycine-generating enzyme required for sulfatase activity
MSAGFTATLWCLAMFSLAVAGDCQSTLAEPSTATTEPFSAKPEGTRAGQERDDNGLGMKLVWCPPGKFTMGSPQSEKGYGERHYDYENQVSVTLTGGFWLGKYEITQGEWKRMMGTTPWKGQDSVKEGTDYPATYVSWHDANEFCGKLTQLERSAGRLPEGWQYALPTEAQWEYACRAGTTTRFSFGNDESAFGSYAWWGGFSGDGNAKNEQYAHQIGTKKANPWGLHDMHGNVWEWCRDAPVFKLPGGIDPAVKFQGLDFYFSGRSWRVIKGGGWWHDAVYCRSAERNWSGSNVLDFSLGFRIARSSGK